MPLTVNCGHPTQMEEINPDFAETDVALVIGAHPCAIPDICLPTHQTRHCRMAFADWSLALNGWFG